MRIDHALPRYCNPRLHGWHLFSCHVSTATQVPGAVHAFQPHRTLVEQHSERHTSLRLPRRRSNPRSMHQLLPSHLRRPKPREDRGTHRQILLEHYNRASSTRDRSIRHRTRARYSDVVFRAHDGLPQHEVLRELLHQRHHALIHHWQCQRSDGVFRRGRQTVDVELA